MRLHRALPLFLLAGWGCSSQTTIGQPAAFQRPQDVAFFCWDLREGSVGRPAPLSDCTPPEPQADAEDVTDDGEPPANYALHALVTQTGTGEVAAVRITGDEAGVIDSDLRVPGYTFAPVGDVPSGVAVSHLDPKHAFVSSRGDSAIHIIAVADLRKGIGTQVRHYDSLPAAGRAHALRLTPDESALVVLLPGTHQVARIALMGDGELGTPEFLLLDPSVPAAVDLSVLDPSEQPPHYSYACGQQATSAPTPIAPRDPVELGDNAKPWSMVFDEELGRLLIADRARPIVHVVELAGFTELPSITTGVPTQALALSPRVPGQFASAPTERYLYAIDASDLSVMAIDYSDSGNARFGAVLTVDEDELADRIELPFGAQAIEVVWPNYDPAESPSCDVAAAAPTALSGVFLAVATLDGRIRFVEIHDQDAGCRGVGCADGVPSDDVFVAITRHRPRFGARVNDAIALDGAPSWDTDGAGAVNVSEDGSTLEPSRVPALQAMACPENLQPGYGADEADARICINRDFYRATAQALTLAFEGALVDARDIGGRLEPSMPLLHAGFDACGVGVLAADAATGELADYAGDEVAITADLPPSVLNSDDNALVDFCSSLVQRTTSTITAITLPVASASVDEFGAATLEVGPPTSPASIEGRPTTLDDVRRCYPELLTFEVRVRDGFLVSASRDGARNPLVRDTDGRCVLDEAQLAAGERMRAFFERPFVTPTFALAFGARPAAITRPTLSFAITNTPLSLSVDASTLGITRQGVATPSVLSGLIYNPVDQRLYAIEQTRVGLARLRLSSLSWQTFFD